MNINNEFLSGFISIICIEKTQTKLLLHAGIVESVETSILMYKNHYGI